MIEHNFAHQAIAVGVQPAAGQTKNRVAGWIDLPETMWSRSTTANAEAGQVVIARLIEVVRMAVSPADRAQSASMQPSLIPHNPGSAADRPSTCQIIEKDERFAAGAEGVVDGHGDQIDSDGIVFAHHRRDFGLVSSLDAALYEGTAGRVLAQQPTAYEAQSSKIASRWANTIPSESIVAMSVNDALCTGGEPLVFLDYLASRRTIRR